MLINKIFHLRQPVAEARQHLRSFGTWSGDDGEVQCSMIEREGIEHLECSTTEGHRVSTNIEELPGDDPNRILFRSVGGNVELTGIIELFAIRHNLTEVVLTLDYEGVSPLQKVFGKLDRFLNRQLGRIEGCMERARGAGGWSGGFA